MNYLYIDVSTNSHKFANSIFKYIYGQQLLILFFQFGFIEIDQHGSWHQSIS